MCGQALTHVHESSPMRTPKEPAQSSAEVTKPIEPSLPFEGWHHHGREGRSSQNREELSLVDLQHVSGQVAVRRWGKGGGDAEKRQTRPAGQLALRGCGDCTVRSEVSHLASSA